MLEGLFFFEQPSKCINCPDWTPRPVTLLSLKNAININKMWLLFLAALETKWRYWHVWLFPPGSDSASLSASSWFSSHQLPRRSLQVSSLLPRCISSSHLFHNNSTIFPPRTLHLFHRCLRRHSSHPPPLPSLCLTLLSFLISSHPLCFFFHLNPQR